MNKKCVGCGSEFPARDPRQKRCKPDCSRVKTQSVKDSHAARTKLRTAHKLRFVGIDGEGVTDADGRHNYVLLSVGNRSLHNDGAQLSFLEIMSFLWECFQADPGAVYVGYFLGYDFTHWLRTLPSERADMLLSKSGQAKRAPKRRGNGNNVPFPVEYEGWEFDILGTKKFKLRKRGASTWMHICDVGSFFQKSFLGAINPKSWPDPICTDEEYDIIVEGKSIRSTAGFDKAMIQYNITENAVLSKLMDRLNMGFVEADVRLDRDRWFGPGQAAQAWMALIGAPTGDSIRQEVPVLALEAAQHAYFGGWFEIFAHGLIPGTAYEYDINSAYPHIISGLPCLLHGDWQNGEGSPPAAPWTLIRATVTGRDRYVGAMLHRMPHGVICRPKKTSGWFWRHEVEAARRAGLISSVRYHEWVTYQPCDCLPPYRSIAELYQRRLDVGKNTPQGMALKLLYNSSYGKMAQSIGKPKYSCSVYASLITAGCRTMILDAIGTHPERTNALLMVATDGVYFRTPHPTLDIDGGRLGAWDESRKQNLSLFMPGVYWDDKSRETVRAGNAPSLKSRGISARDLSMMIETIDRQWAEWSIGDEAPSISIPVAFNMITATQALARGKWELCGQVKNDGFKAISADPSNKRRDMSWSMDGREYIDSLPYEVPWNGPIESTPYDQTFGMEEIDYTEAFDWETPDGSVNGLVMEAFNYGEA